MGLERTVRWVAALALAALGALVLYGAARVAPPEALAIRWVDVTGAFARVSAEQIRSAAAPHLEGGFLAADPVAARRAVEGLAWVQVAEVEKDWPDTVRIRVEEHWPLARWGDGRLLSEGGQLFAVDRSMVPAGLPELIGPEEHAVEMVVFYREMERRLEGTGFDVRRLERSPRGGWSAELAEGFSLELGSVEPLPRLVRFLATLPRLERLPDRELVGADLRYGNGFAVRWRYREGDGLPEVDGGTLIAARHLGAGGTR